MGTRGLAVKAAVIGAACLALGAGAGAGEAAGAAAVRGVDFDVQGFLDAELARGGRTVVIPPGRYRVTPRRAQHLVLKGLADVTVVADGVEMICTETTRALTISDCTNVTLRGLAIDYDPLPFTQGRIVRMSPDKGVHEIELFDGYPGAESVLPSKYEIFRPDTRTLRGPEHECRVEPAGPRGLRVTKTRTRPDDAEQVGDLVVIASAHAPHGSAGHAVECSRNRNVRLERVTVYASNCFGFLEYDCDGTTYLGCRVDRRPPETDFVSRASPRLRSLNADAFHSKHAVKGPSLIGCVARFQGDDGLNICGDYHFVTASTGRVLRVLAKQGRTINIAEGDRVELLSYTGVRLSDARVTAVAPDAPPGEAEAAFIGRQRMNDGLRRYLPKASAFRIALDREVELPMGSAICNAGRTGNGFVVRDCSFGWNRSRGILIKAGDGVVEGNTLEENWGEAIKVAPEWWWLESGSTDRVRIERNAIRDCRTVAIAVHAAGGTGAVAPAGAHHDIAVIGNRISGCARPNIVVTSTTGLRLEGNRCEPRDDQGVTEWARRAFGLGVRDIGCEETIHCEPAGATRGP